MEKDLFLHNQRRALITEEDNETQRFLGFLVRYQQRSPKVYVQKVPENDEFTKKVHVTTN